MKEANIFILFENDFCCLIKIDRYNNTRNISLECFFF